MRKQLSIYKWKKLSVESLRNGIRLTLDAILLFKNGSYPSAFHLAVLSLEEISKSEWIEHYYYSSITNQGFPDKNFEQEWLYLLYNHARKQNAFFARINDWYDEDFIKMVKTGELDLKKQKATYVGLERNKKDVNVNGRISLPTMVKLKDAKEMISVIVDRLKFYFHRYEVQEYYFNIWEKHELLTEDLFARLKLWKYKCVLKKYYQM